MKNKEVIYFDEEKGKLIQKVRDEVFLIKPIPNYNFTTYKVVSKICSCQGFKTYGNCSHVEAVILFENLKISKLNAKAGEMRK